MAKMKACPVCGQKVGIEKLAAHVKKVHPRETVDIKLDEEEQKEVRAAKKASRPSTGSGGKWIVLLTAVVVVIIVLAFVLAPRGFVGTDPVDFTLPPSDGGSPWNLRSHIGSKPILLEFMHPQCHVCIDEVDVTSQNHPPYSLQDLWNNYAADVEFVSIAIVLESPGFTNPPTAQMMEDFKSDYNTWWTYLVDSGTTARDQYGITGTPTFFLIGKSTTGGKIIYEQAYGGDLTKLKSEIDKELAR